MEKTSQALAANTELTQSRLTKQRYWQAYRESIEDYVKAVERNENGSVIHCLAKVVAIRESDLNRLGGL